MFGKLRIPLSPDPQFCSTQLRHSFFSPGHGSVAQGPQKHSGVKRKFALSLALVVHKQKECSLNRAQID
ncbi:hypothetical protein TNCV_3016621 [Trichonephila clavipes]|nr:hypothetical protein TNCV_3016621 [Trichonephila clavipes]